MPTGSQQQAGGMPANGAGSGMQPGAGGTEGGGQPGATGDQQQQAQTPPNFETWYATQDESTRGLIDTHTRGLKSALDSERQLRADLSKQLKDAAGKLEKGSDAEKALTDLQAKLQQAENRAAFIETAIKPEIGCINPKLAYLVASTEQLFNRHGDPDWEAIRKAAPELFRITPLRTGSADGGAGNGSTPPADMNQLIRRAAGRG